MRLNYTFLAALLLICMSISTFGQTAPAAPQISFTISMLKPHTHLLEVDIAIKHAASDNVANTEQLIMPVWTPGSYLVREFERQVQDFEAKDASGSILNWEKVNKNTWRVSTNGSRDWHATYRVYANELSVRTNELNSSHAFWNNAALLMYLDGYLKSPSTVHVLAPDVWKVATGLPAAPGQRNTFRAENYDVLYDSPFEVSNFKTIAFNVKGVAHRIVIDGDGNYDADKLKRDVQKIVETEVELMGGQIPYHDYTFILHLRPNAGGGLEHLNSTALGYPRFGFNERSQRVSSAAPNPGTEGQASYRGFLSLVAHEFFHLWNVKRIRPDALGPFDYTKENYTKVLWVAEGITDYYSEVALVRSGLISEGDFLGNTAQSVQSLQHVPGRLVQSVEEASYDAWIKYYRPDENSPNSQVSYYDKGAILGMLLDLEIRRRSGGTKSLDHVMRYLYDEYFKKDRNYSPQDFQKAVELMAGSSLEEFFVKYVHGREELDYNTSLSAVGLTLETTAPARNSQNVGAAFLGADTAQDGEKLIVRRVYAGTPAYEQGLNTGDQIVALNNMRVNKEFFEARLAEKRPGDLINLTIFRFDDLSTLLIKLGTKADGTYRLVPVPNATPTQKQAYRSWLGPTAQ